MPRVLESFVSEWALAKKESKLVSVVLPRFYAMVR